MLVSVGPPLADLQFLRTQATIMPALSGGGVNAQGQLPHGALHTRGAASAARTVRHTRKIGRSVLFLVLFSWYLFLVLVSVGPPLADLQFLRTQATIMPALSEGGCRCPQF